MFVHDGPVVHTTVERHFRRALAVKPRFVTVDEEGTAPDSDIPLDDSKGLVSKYNRAVTIDPDRHHSIFGHITNIRSIDDTVVRNHCQIVDVMKLRRRGRR